MPFLKKLSGRFTATFSDEKKLRRSFRIIVGKYPLNLALYKQAMIHVSIAKINNRGIKKSYERLEYLGDAVLNMVVAEFLYLRYPFREEGFLTEIRAKIVSGESLNQLSQKIGLTKMVMYDSQPVSKSIYGDALEALIGAIYLDRGLHFCKKFVKDKLINPHYDMDKLITTIINYKSKLLEWSQKENMSIRFDTVNGKDRKFITRVIINEIPRAKGYGFSKKKAEQDAARKTYEQLNLMECLAS